MKFFNLCLVALMLVFTLFVAQPSWADHIKLDQNADYLELTKTLDELTQSQKSGTLPEGLTLGEVEQKINSLQFEKYILENAEEAIGICTNNSGKTLGVYGEKPKNFQSTFDNIIYLLPDGESTDDNWDCQGIYIPNDAQVSGLPLETAAAIKVIDGTDILITSNTETGELEFNIPISQVFKTGEINWDIPDLPQVDLETQITTSAPLD